MKLRQYEDLVPLTKFDRERSSAFSYACAACSKCCYAKVIRVGPYEALRLARHLGISTTALIRDYTEAGGTVLRTREDSACVFLGAKGCTVHANRPLACRIYPLSWYIDGYGNETFGLLTGHPESEGELGTAGTVDAYCASQELEPYLEMARRYIRAHDRMLSALKERASNAPTNLAIEKHRQEVDRLEPGTLATAWLDVDAVVEEYCQKHAREVPTDIEETIALHISAIEAWASPT